MTGRDHSAPSGVPDVLLERYLSDDLEPEARERVAARIDQSPEAKARLEELSAAREAFLSADPPEMFAHRVAVEVAVAQEAAASPQGAKRKLWMWLIGPAGLAATGLVLAVTFSMTGKDEATKQFEEVAQSAAPAVEEKAAPVEAEPAPEPQPKSAADRALRAQEEPMDWKPANRPSESAGVDGAYARADKVSRRGARRRARPAKPAPRLSRAKPKSSVSGKKPAPARTQDSRLLKEQAKGGLKNEGAAEERMRNELDDREAEEAAPRDAPPPAPAREAPKVTAPSSAPAESAPAEPEMDFALDEDAVSGDVAEFEMQEEKKDASSVRAKKARKRAPSDELFDSVASKSSTLGGAGAASAPRQAGAKNKQAVPMTVTWLLPKGGKVRDGAVLDGGRNIQLRGVLPRGYAAVAVLTASGQVRFTKAMLHGGGSWSTSVTLPKVSRDTVARVFVVSSPSKFGFTKAALQAQVKNGLPNRLKVPSGAQQRSLRLRIQGMVQVPAAGAAESVDK